MEVRVIICAAVYDLSQTIQLAAMVDISLWNKLKAHVFKQL